jgi:hypothetical protein
VSLIYPVEFGTKCARATFVTEFSSPALLGRRDIGKILSEN